MEGRKIQAFQIPNIDWLIVLGCVMVVASLIAGLNESAKTTIRPGEWLIAGLLLVVTSRLNLLVIRCGRQHCGPNSP